MGPEVIRSGYRTSRPCSVTSPYLALAGLHGVHERMGSDLTLGITSRVTVRERNLFDVEWERHLVQLDFDFSTDDYAKSLRNILDTINELYGGPGFIVRSSRNRSGRGFHFYGNRVLSQDEWNTFMEGARVSGKQNYDCEGLDTRWAEIQQLSGFSVLRVSPPEGKGEAPVPILELE